MARFVGLAVVALQLATAAAPLPQPGCPRTCGGVAIEYPFGIGPNCSLSDGFNVECVDDTPRLRLGGGGEQEEVVKVLRIDLLRGKIRTTNTISWQCTEKGGATAGARLQNSSWTGLNATALPYRFSDEDNRFFTLGCNALVFLNGEASGIDDPILSGCISTCFGNASIRNGTCSGIGCCEMAIPRGLNSYSLEFTGPLVNSSSNNDWCIYAALMESAGFSFEVAYATTDMFYRKNNGTVPLLLNFVVGNETCKEAQASGGYACAGDHSVCVDAVDGPGYVCNCSQGYTGNPYLPDGCTGTTVGVGGGLAIVVTSILSTYLVRQRRALADVKRKYFAQHGGLLLYEELSSRQGNAFTIYTEEQLEQASNGFDESNVLGRGGHGTVYKGTVASGVVVAIKRCKLMDERNKKEFGKEMLILSQINHKNIVKLLGCCLEVDVPMLVYEYVPNGTLYQLIHGGPAAAAAVSFATRLRIAHESAESLAYLHSFASPPILHGDVKSSNILLDESFMAKVSDFGASILAPTDEAQMVTMVQGTCGYLDPEYMQTCQLTEKSDVYSFGVVLLELLTGEKPLCLDGPEEGRSLSARFLAAMRETRVDKIVDEKVKGEASDELLEEITQLALECLQMCGGDRPAMKEVAERLGRMRRLHQHPWTQDAVELEEARCLLGSSPESISFEVDASHGTDSSGY
ncbi:putative wall-associated receptor kinase-like 16 [Oryza brachyantha]|uniref:putative wall-associated receptor kinase-like 16 n=1 Tax=Oryza brachyantha TaxID=4533 RepID=UPI001ADA68DF|nr:putative wall-associated receptor kinase-like 16 [Oryza brachyantha]